MCQKSFRLKQPRDDYDAVTLRSGLPPLMCADAIYLAPMVRHVIPQINNGQTNAAKHNKNRTFEEAKLWRTGSLYNI